MAKKLLIVCALLALISTSLFAQYDMKAPLPMDPNVRIGKLANGLTYYIRHNAEPKERASFYINQENHLFISIFNSIISFPKFYRRIR